MGNAYVWIGLTAVMFVGGVALPAAQAGVRVEVVDAAGGGTNGASISHRTLYFQGSQSRNVWTVTFTSPWMRNRLKREGRSNPNTEIIIDRARDNLEFSLNPDNKTYREDPINSGFFSKPKTPVPDAVTPPVRSGGSRSHIREVKAEVEPTGQRKVINGFPARLYRFVTEEEAEDSKTGRIVRSRLIKDLWISTAPRVLTAYKDYMTYNRALAKVYHTTLSMDSVRQIPMLMMPFTFGERPKPGRRDPLAKLPGFPVEVSSRWVVDCLSHCAAGDSASRGLAAEPSGPAKKDTDDSDTHATHQAARAGTAANVLFASHTEILAIKVGRFPASLFEVPAGYKKQ